LFGNCDSKLEKYFSAPVRKCTMSYLRTSSAKDKPAASSR
jgi:hypothetical protein